GERVADDRDALVGEPAGVVPAEVAGAGDHRCRAVPVLRDVGGVGRAVGQGAGVVLRGARVVGAHEAGDLEVGEVGGAEVTGELLGDLRGASLQGGGGGVRPDAGVHPLDQGVEDGGLLGAAVAAVAGAVHVRLAQQLGV